MNVGASAIGPSDPQGSDLFSRELTRRLFLPTVLAIFAYGGLLLYFDAEATLEHARDVSAQTLWLATALAASNYVIRFVRWEYCLRLLSIRVPLVESALVFVAGFAMSITPGKMGEVLKSLLLKQSQDVPVARSAPVVLAERVTDLAGLLLLGALGALDLRYGALVAVACVACVLFLFASCTFRPLGNGLIALVTRVGRLSRLRGKLQAAYDSLVELTRPLPFCVGVAISVVAWGAQCLSLNVLAWGFADVTLSLQHGLLAYSAPLLAGTLALIPGGLGLTEASMAGALQALGGPGMVPAVAAAITILSRLTSFWLAVGLGFVALAVWRARRVARA